MNALMNNEFTKWFMICVMQKYADFNGRARRKEYWMFYLVYIIAVILLSVIDGLILSMPILTGIFSLGMIVPCLAAGVRRLHDVGKSGWFLLVSLVPIVGPIYLLYLFILEGTPGENRYGPNPKGM